MSKPIIFDLNKNRVLKSNKLSLEKELQRIVEQNMEKNFLILDFLHQNMHFEMKKATEELIL